MNKYKGPIITSTEAINKAEKMFGSGTALAKKIGTTRQRLYYWKSNTLLPYEKAMAIYVVTDGAVSIDELRPDQKAWTRKFKALSAREYDKQKEQKEQQGQQEMNSSVKI